MRFRRLLAFTLSALLIVVSPAVVGATRPVPPPSHAVVAEWDIFARVNAERRARDIAPLHGSKVLTTWAVNWARSMATTDGFKHSNLGPLLKTFDFAGENIAVGATDAGSLHGALMRSAGHRDNLLNPEFAVMAVGVFCGKDGRMWVVEDFGRPWSQGYPRSVGPSAPDPVVRPNADSKSC